MAKSINPGIAIAIFLNVILLLGIPFFGEGEVGRIAPLLLLAFAMPWILCWAVGRLIAEFRGGSSPDRERDGDGPPDFV